MNFLIIWGTRPEIIKLSPIIRYLAKKKIPFSILDTNQHYNFEMSQIFYQELDLPTPDYHLELLSKNSTTQIAFMMKNINQILKEDKPDIVIAQGDTNTVLASALASYQASIPFGHVEAGIRSYDQTMPEEINRRIASVVSNIHFCPTNLSRTNLLVEGIDPNRIVLTGNTIVDAIKFYLEKEKIKINFRRRYQIPKNEPFIPITLHRPANVDNKKILIRILKAISNLPAHFLMLTHPRTLERMKKFGIDYRKMHPNIIFEKSIGYFEFLELIQQSTAIITDSGGIQEESVTLQIPCITLRPNTERYESILLGYNQIINPNSSNFVNNLSIAFHKAVENKIDMKNKTNPFGLGDSSQKIIESCFEFYNTNNLHWDSPDFTEKFPRWHLTDTGINPRIVFDIKGEIHHPSEKEKGSMFLSFE